MFIGAQYYRPPFPERKYWDGDLDLMRDSGINAVQLWACWGWIEPEPGVFRFEDYDELVDKCRKRGLDVIISTIAEIHPFWIHRVVPDSSMIDHMGNKVISTLRGECNVGLTPGGCFDNPKVLELMGAFLGNISRHYADEKSVIGWDCWNETRWNVQSDGYVCHCPHTIDRFRNWLKEKYGSLEGLNDAWRRRYCSWGDVLPGKLPGRPYTETTEFLRFLTWRAGRHMKFRYERIRENDSRHFISAHCGSPCTMSLGGWGYEQAMCRGNDWDHADQLDGFGCSHFPFWGEGFDEAGYGARVESVRSAVRDKVMWVSELQGGSARDGFTAHRSVPPQAQQAWVWNGFARGAKGVIFWCWRDEVFGRESSGFGLAGNDGLAKERLGALKATSEFLGKHGTILDDYRPDAAKVGVLFEPDNYYLNWAQDGNSEKAGNSLLGYLHALERLQVPYEVLESSHMGALAKIRLLILPWPLVVNRSILEPLAEFISNGGTILCEAEMDAFDPLGFYRYSGEGRELAALLGIRDDGRRTIGQDRVEFSVGGKKFGLKVGGWITPLNADAAPHTRASAADAEKHVIAVERKFGRGSVYALGTFLGMGYQEKRYKEFEDFLLAVISKAGAMTDVKLGAPKGIAGMQWKSGMSGSNRLLFVTNLGKARKITVRHGKVTRVGIKANSWNVFFSLK